MYLTPIENAIDIIKKVLKRHPPECVFELNAPTNIFNRLAAGGFITSDGFFVFDDRLDQFRECWQLSEIYCPHEGIDRLSEYGLAVKKLGV